MGRMALLCSEGLAHTWVRIQLRHAAPAIQFLTVFASSGAVFQTNDKFEHIPFLAHWLEAHFVIDTATVFCSGRKSEWTSRLRPKSQRLRQEDAVRACKIISCRNIRSDLGWIWS